MRQYELMCIFEPDLDETALNGMIEKIKGWVAERGGSIEKVDVWGRRKLAYPIRKKNEGQYVLFNLKLAPSATAELERTLRYQEAVMRHLLILNG